MNEGCTYPRKVLRNGSKLCGILLELKRETVFFYTVDGTGYAKREFANSILKGWYSGGRVGFDASGRRPLYPVHCSISIHTLFKEITLLTLHCRVQWEVSKGGNPAREHVCEGRIQYASSALQHIDAEKLRVKGGCSMPGVQYAVVRPCLIKNKDGKTKGGCN